MNLRSIFFLSIAALPLLCGCNNSSELSDFDGDGSFDSVVRDVLRT
jgi:hypothetical protein